MSKGSSVKWPYLFKAIVGHQRLEVEPLLEYFKPLHGYLCATNRKTNEYIGWKNWKTAFYLVRRNTTIYELTIIEELEDWEKSYLNINIIYKRNLSVCHTQVYHYVNIVFSKEEKRYSKIIKKNNNNYKEKKIIIRTWADD